jgi:hypothetical protein
MSDCLHCDISELVREHLEGGKGDLVEIASMMAESLADLLLLASKEDRANLMEHVVSTLGQMLPEKSGAFEDGSSTTHLRGRAAAHAN